MEWRDKPGCPALRRRLRTLKIAPGQLFPTPYPAATPGRQEVLSTVRVYQTLGRERTQRCVALGHFSNWV